MSANFFIIDAEMIKAVLEVFDARLTQRAQLCPAPAVVTNMPPLLKELLSVYGICASFDVIKRFFAIFETVNSMMHPRALDGMTEKPTQATLDAREKFRPVWEKIQADLKAHVDTIPQGATYLSLLNFFERILVRVVVCLDDMAHESKSIKREMSSDVMIQHIYDLKHTTVVEPFVQCAYDATVVKALQEICDTLNKVNTDLDKESEQGPKEEVVDTMASLAAVLADKLKVIDDRTALAEEAASLLEALKAIPEPESLDGFVPELTPIPEVVKEEEDEPVVKDDDPEEEEDDEPFMIPEDESVDESKGEGEEPGIISEGESIDTDEEESHTLI
jgi:hypothetical protein